MPANPKVIVLGLLIVIIFGLGFAAAYFKYRPELVAADSDELLLQELRKAKSIGNNVLQSRSIIDHDGSFKSDAQTGWWESISPVSQVSGLPPLRADHSTVVVFVHGYNVSLDRSIMYGNAVWSELQQVGPKAGSADYFQQVTFCTFCWRGDFGPEHFGTAENSARNTAASLAGLMVKLQEQAASEHKQVSFILISHSLGAMVCLEALNQLWHRDHKPWVRCLLMLEPAVQVETISHGQYTETLVWSEPGPGGRLMRNVERTTQTNSAVYFDAFQAANTVLATSSAADEVLGKLYYPQARLDVKCTWEAENDGLVADHPRQALIVALYGD